MRERERERGQRDREREREGERERERERDERETDRLTGIESERIKGNKVKTKERNKVAGKKV